MFKFWTTLHPSVSIARITWLDRSAQVKSVCSACVNGMCTQREVTRVWLYSQAFICHTHQTGDWDLQNCYKSLCVCINIISSEREQTFFTLLCFQLKSFKILSRCHTLFKTHKILYRISILLFSCVSSLMPYFGRVLLPSESHRCQIPLYYTVSLEGLSYFNFLFHSYPDTWLFILLQWRHDNLVIFTLK